MSRVALISLIILTLLFISCREEIISPDTFVESINEPVQINENNSYTYLLNANKFTSTLEIISPINTTASQVSITLIDYNGGYANILIKDNDDKERYRYFMAENIEMFTDITEGYVPKTIEIRTFEFTGKLKIRLSRGIL